MFRSMATTEKLIFTNGCFDIVHVGHIKLLEFAKSLGSRLVVGINSDASIKRLKGFERPINNENDRCTLLRAIKYVDSVYLFQEDTPYNLICSLKPDIIVKGGDYTPSQVVGNDVADVVIFDYIKGYSTTNIIKKAKEK